MELAPLFKKAYWSLAFAGLVYVLAIFSLTYPAVQRGALYSNAINPSPWQDVNDAEYFGFQKSQVQPFNIVTPDNETLYAWHIIPPYLCKEFEEDLLANPPSGPAEDITKTLAYKLLAENPNARVVVNLHGNAAHIGSGYRPNTYRSHLAASTPTHPVHVIAFDYRGFGKSTGTPTEEGLITDAEAVITYLTSAPLSISPSRIAIAGQSLGTAVAAGLAERLTFTKALSEPFATILLFAPFSNVPTLLESYQFFGLLPPIFSPIVGYPRAKKYILNHVVDTWDTASRLARLTGVKPHSEDDHAVHGDQAFDVKIIHAANDFEIPWREGRRAWAAAVGGEDNAAKLGTFVKDHASEDGVTQLEVWEKEIGADPRTGEKRVKRVTWERVRYGGHNRVAATSAATLAIMRAFENNK
ncbi:hypothetical protein AJ80_06065 [Polytolypa hystricis UAMH7299]|uniref:AB hydrolase-1 domain-containing protein n=1 Tax=Polytolypa hystricis (strain UAMH7299) TaxID=1447883 RepID=A0A2B7XZ55_POLH7|nr:hypothetical protein AJ80_06065 [Polytolypa hystricis UAMH7299]